MGSESNFCEFCRQTVELACADPGDCVLGHESKYVAWQDGCSPPPGKYRVRLQNGRWGDAESVWENGEFAGFDYLLGLWEWECRQVVGYVPIDTVEPVQPRDMECLKHMLGIQSNIRKVMWGYRNRFCSAPGSDDYESMQRLESAGLVERGRNIGDMVTFHATQAGCEAVGLSKRQIANAMGG